MNRRYWLIKSEGDCYSIDDLKKDKTTGWTGVRNYQARNFMRDSMEIGDLALFYHSQAEPSGIYGIAKVSSHPYADPTVFDKDDEHYDPSSKKDSPKWMMIDVTYVKKFVHPISLSQLKLDPMLEGMVVRQKGSRLSIQPVSEDHFNYIVNVLAQ